MNIQPMATETFDIKNGTSSVNTYLPLEHIPEEFYSVFINWVETNADSLKDLYISVTTEDGYIILPVGSGSGKSLDGLGINEIELRGALVDFDRVRLTYIKLNSKFEVILHTTNGEYAFPIKITDNVDSKLISKLFKTAVIKKLKRGFDSVTITHDKVDVCCTKLSKPTVGLFVE